ncbi:hypothetical protein [Methanimicrococcus hacksteinii]|uniref:hypothetical protein n=1 Tax=Methanimicrococcus hacksteinii TaxID=3028293 RepID=UPI00298EE09F|nr:hypothetical protein [Methanimicrococcus sp. At1]
MITNESFKHSIKLKGLLKFRWQKENKNKRTKKRKKQQKENGKTTKRKREKHQKENGKINKTEI